MDAVFKALADPTRRRLLDRLRARNGQTLRELCERAEITRQAVTKHLNVLKDAHIVRSVKAGRERGGMGSSGWRGLPTIIPSHH